MPTKSALKGMPGGFSFRIYRYIFEEVLLPFFGGFFFFTFVFLMFQVVKLADYFINHGVGLFLLFKLTTYISAAFLPVVLPISFLVATLMAFGRLSADSEIVALKASGFSLFRLYLPVALMSVLVAGTVFYLTYYFIPWGNREFKRTIIKLGNTKVVSNIKEGTFTEGFFDLLVYADKVNVQQNKLLGVLIHDERDPKNPMIILAQEGVVTPLKAESDLGVAAIFRLKGGSIHRSDIQRSYYEKIDFDEYRLMLKVEEAQTGDLTYPKTLGSSELLEVMKKSRGDPKMTEYAIEYWKRIALAITPILFGILGVGLGIVRMRSIKSNALFFAFGIVTVYWGLHILGASLAEKQWMSPFLAMQLSNIVVLPLSVLSFKKSSW